MRVRGVRFADEDALWAAVLDGAAAEWRALAGRDLSEHDRANFKDRDLPEHEVCARTVTARLAGALADARRFASDYRIKLARRELPEPASETRGLLTYIEMYVPSLIGEHVPLATLHPPQENGWRVHMRGRVLSLLGPQSLGYWRHLGLTKPPTTRTMALATLLLGCRPTVNKRDLSAGITVATVVQLETNAVRAQARRKPKKKSTPTA